MKTSLAKRLDLLEARRATGRVIPSVVVYREGESRHSMLQRFFAIHGEPAGLFRYLAIPESTTSIEDYDYELERYQDGIEYELATNHAGSNGCPANRRHVSAKVRR